MPYDILAEGADPTGAVDASACIRAGLAAGEDILIPDGTFTVSRDGANVYCLDVPAGARIFGSGTLRLAAGASVSTRILNIAASGVTLDGFTLDGNRSNQSVESNPQRHALIVNGSGVSVRNLRITGAAGDGVVIGQDIEGVSITNTRIGDAQRDGITFGTGTVLDVLIAHCHIEATVQPIDSEPSSGQNSQVRIIGNRLDSTGGDYALTMTHSDDWIISDNHMVGALYVYEAAAKIRGNVIDATASPALHALRILSADALTITDNTIRAAANQHGIMSNGWSSDWIERDNHISVSGTGRRIFN